MRKLYNKIIIWFGDYFYNPYCKKCGSCGEAGCCSPVNCLMKQKFNCEYGEYYKKDLKFAYLMLDELYDIADKVEREKLHDKYYDKVYGNANKP